MSDSDEGLLLPLQPQDEPLIEEDTRSDTGFAQITMGYAGAHRRDIVTFKAKLPTVIRFKGQANLVIHLLVGQTVIVQSFGTPDVVLDHLPMVTITRSEHWAWRIVQ